MMTYLRKQIYKSLYLKTKIIHANFLKVNNIKNRKRKKIFLFSFAALGHKNCFVVWFLILIRRSNPAKNYAGI